MPQQHFYVVVTGPNGQMWRQQLIEEPNKPRAQTAIDYETKVLGKDYQVDLSTIEYES